MKSLFALAYLLICLGTAMVGYEIHGNGFYAVINFLFAPFSLIYWLITHSLTLDVIVDTFEWFYK